MNEVSKTAYLLDWWCNNQPNTQFYCPGFRVDRKETRCIWLFLSSRCIEGSKLNIDIWFFIGNRSWKTTVLSQVTVFFLHVTTRTVDLSPCIAPRQGGDGWIQVSDPFWTSGSDWHLEPESKWAKLAWKIAANLTELLRQLDFLNNDPARVIETANPANDVWWYIDVRQIYAAMAVASNTGFLCRLNNGRSLGCPAWMNNGLVTEQLCCNGWTGGNIYIIHFYKKEGIAEQP